MKTFNNIQTLSLLSVMNCFLAIFCDAVPYLLNQSINHENQQSTDSVTNEGNSSVLLGAGITGGDQSVFYFAAFYFQNVVSVRCFSDYCRCGSFDLRLQDG